MEQHVRYLFNKYIDRAVRHATELMPVFPGY